MNTFFIADPHFGHKNILSFDNRPFKTIEEHDEAIVERWNSVVSDWDVVWVLGDISWYGAEKTVEIFNRLNGIKKLCIGNHDRRLIKNEAVRALFAEIKDYEELYTSKSEGIVLSHWPIPCFNKHFYGWVHLYGHVHNSFEENMMQHDRYRMMALYDKPCEMYNVGAMMPYMSYTPRTLEEIIEGAKSYNVTED